MNSDDIFISAVVIMRNMLPDDFKWETTAPEYRNRRNYPIAHINVLARDSTAPSTAPLQELHFEMFVYEGKLITQELNPQNGIMARYEIPLADPECFEKTHNFFARRCVK